MFLTQSLLYCRINLSTGEKMTYQQLIGNKGEIIAANYLANKGFQVLEKNFKTRYGELDLVALEADCIVFVEVKTRTSTKFGVPEDSVTPQKIERLQKAGLLWLQEHPEAPDDWRVDVIALLIDARNFVLDIKHFVNVL